MALLLAADALTLFNVKTSHIVYMHIKKKARIFSLVN